MAMYYLVNFSVSSICYFTMSVYFMALLYCITLTAEEAFDALQSLNTPLEKMLLNENDFTQREHIKATMRKLEKAVMAVLILLT